MMGISPLKLNKEEWYVRLIKNYFIKGANAYFANGTIGKLELQSYDIKDDKIFNQCMTVDIDYFFKKLENKEKFKKEIK